MKKLIPLICFLCLFFGNASAEELVIAHIADPHFGISPTWDQRFSDVLWMSEKQAQVIFITGDITNGPNRKKDYLMMENFVERIKGVTIPLLAVRGNHDNPNAFQEIIGSLEWVYDTGGYRIIGIDTLNVDFIKLNQWMTLEKRLIVLGHHPLDCRMSPCMTHSVATKLRQLFTQYRVVAYFSGHEHHARVKVNESGTVLITSPSVRDGRYLLVYITDSMVDDIVNIWVKMEEIPIEYPQPPKIDYSGENESVLQDYVSP